MMCGLLIDVRRPRILSIGLRVSKQSAECCCLSRVLEVVTLKCSLVSWTSLHRDCLPLIKQTMLDGYLYLFGQWKRYPNSTLMSTSSF